MVRRYRSRFARCGARARSIPCHSSATVTAGDFQILAGLQVEPRDEVEVTLLALDDYIGIENYRYLSLGEITRGFGYGDDRLFHKIRFSDFKARSAQESTTDPAAFVLVIALIYFAAAVSRIPISGTVLPTTAAIWRTWAISSSNCSGRSDCGPSDKASSGL